MNGMEQQTSLRLSSELLQKLDDWCETQPLHPTRAQAIRSFLEEALKPKRVPLAGYVQNDGTHVVTRWSE